MRIGNLKGKVNYQKEEKTEQENFSACQFGKLHAKFDYLFSLKRYVYFWDHR
jgi:hypothetical protein